MLKKLVLGLLAVIVVLVIVVAIQPSDFRVARSATFAASPEVLFEQVNNLHKGHEWSPFTKIDPNAKYTFKGPEAGVGAICEWDGNSEAGAGTLTIIESKPNELVRLKLDFTRPFEATSNVDYAIQPEGDKTTLTWSMYGKNNFLGKAISLVMNCEKMMGPEMEKGLTNLKGVVDAKPTP